MAANLCRPSRNQAEVDSGTHVTGEVCGKAEEAVNFYSSVFRNAPNSPDAGETQTTVFLRYGKGEDPDQEGTVRYALLSLFGQEFGAMDSARADEFSFNEAISFMVPCETQSEIDYFWGSCRPIQRQNSSGWLKDRYGLSWQITPADMREWLGGADKERSARVTEAFLKMKKFDIAALKRAAAG
jgi:predicted 3-demethylubiquinone-9 3-methyltransferase (glyoxalase superfamily)